MYIVHITYITICRYKIFLEKDVLVRYLNMDNITNDRISYNKGNNGVPFS